MKPVKRLEIVIDAPISGRVTDTLIRHGIRGWTMMRGAVGHSDRGERFADEITGVSNNHVLVTTCSAEQLDELVEDLRGLLKRYGGVCIISDAHMLRI